MADAPVGTAFVEIRPDLRGFEAELQAALRSAVRGITPPTAGFAKGATAQAALGAATRGTTKALSEQAVVMQVNSTELARFSRGVAATSLAQFGLRGATLAATSSFLAGAAALTALARAVGLATSFNSQLAVFAATTGATASQMDDVSVAAKALGADLTLPGVSATDAAVAMTELAKAGLSVQDAIEGARGVLQLAGAAGIDFAQATELAASAINAFQLAGRDAVKVADVLANAANAAQGSIVDVGIAFQQAAAVGHQVGLSFQDVTLFITEMAKAGLSGSDAGTSLRTALIRLINPTKKAQEIFKSLGLQVRDAQGNLRPEFFTNLGVAISKMSAKQRDATLAQIGGQDAIRALSILSRANIKDLIAQRDALDKTGTAAKVNEARMTGLKGATAGLSNTVENLALGLGQKATPALIGATVGLTSFITAASHSSTIALLGETLHVVADGVKGLGEAVSFSVPVLSQLVGLLTSVTAAIGPTTILAGVAAYIAFNKVLSISTVGLRLFLAELSTSIALGGGLRAALGLMTESMLAFATSTAGVTLGIGLLVAGLVFLATRESAAERATKALKAATTDLASAMETAAQATDTLSRSQANLNTDKIALKTAQLALIEAKRDQARSKAAAGSLEQQQVENRVAVALDNVHRAQQQVLQDQKEVGQNAKDNAVAQQNRIDAAHKEAEALHSVSDAARAAAQFAFGSGQKGEATQNQIITQSIDDRIAALKKLPGAENAALVARLNAIKQLVGKTKDIDTVIGIVLDAKSLTQGLAQVESLFRRTGNDSGAAFVEAMQIAIDPTRLLKPILPVLDLLKTLGKQGGTNFAEGIVSAVQNALSLVNRLILQGATALTVRLSNQTDTLLQNVQRIELTGGSLDQQLSAAKEARARAERELSAADAAVKASGGRSQAAKERQKKALQDFASAQSEVDRIQGDITQNAKKAADARKKAADDAKKARDDADQAFQQSLGEAQAPIDLRITKAGLTKGVQDDIDAQLALQKFIQTEIREATKSIHDVHTRIAVVNQLRQALVQSQITTKGLIEQQKTDAKQAIIDKRDRQQESLELDIQIAETDKNKGKELKAHQRLLKFLEDRIKHTTAGTVERKRLQLAIEQEKAAIKDLKKANDDKNNALQQLEFSFLQTQAGFAANLLGNLLPAGSVAGTVGVSGALTQTPHGTNLLGGGAVTPAGGPSGGGGGTVIDTAVASDSAKATTPGPSHGQINTLIALARAQLQVLQGRNAKLGHPEATVQRAAQHAAMDTLPF